MFEHIEPYAGDPIFALVDAFNADPRPQKVNLTIGIYFDEQGRLPVLESVRRAEAKAFQAGGPKPYLPMEGDAACRLAVQELYQEDFVIAARKGHPFLARPTLKNYCAASHLMVGGGTDARGFIDDALAKQGLERHVALTVPSFMWALFVLAETDLIGAVPRRLIERHGTRAGLAAVEPPLPLRKDPVGVVTVKAAMSDPALQWLVQQVAGSAGTQAAAVPGRRVARKR